MISDRMIALVQEFNPWWMGKVPKLPEYRRNLYEKLNLYLYKKQILAITGLRRVGKTVIMKQLLISLPDKQFAMYFSFDGLISQNPDVLQDIIQYFIKLCETANNDTDHLEAQKYLFLDEIHKVASWQDILKRFYDMREDLKFIISGSSSLDIFKSKESLAGRIFDFYLPILTYREFIGMHGKIVPKLPLNFEDMRQFWESQLLNRMEFENLLHDYVFQGAFPEMAFEKDELIVKNYVKNSVIETILLKDLPMYADLRKPELLLALLEIAAKNTENLMDVQSLASDLAVNFQTVKSYLFYLEKSFILDLSFNFSGSKVHEFRKNKKVHIAHPSVTIATMRYSREVLHLEEIMGHFIENVAFHHAKLLFTGVHFWRTSQKEEIDLICEGPEANEWQQGSKKPESSGLLPIEVKYRAQIPSGVKKSLVKFMGKHKLREGIILTRHNFESYDDKEQEIRIAFIPAWVFLCCI